MAFDVLLVFRLSAVDVARQVEVEVVLFDFFKTHHASVTWLAVVLAGEGIDDFMNILLTQAILGAVLDETSASVEHKDAFAARRMFLVDNNNAGRDTSAVEQVGRQADNAFDIAVANQLTADFSLSITTKQYAVRQDAGGFALTFQ